MKLAARQQQQQQQHLRVLKATMANMARCSKLHFLSSSPPSRPIDIWFSIFKTIDHLHSTSTAQAQLQFRLQKCCGKSACASLLAYLKHNWRALVLHLDDGIAWADCAKIMAANVLNGVNNDDNGQRLGCCSFSFSHFPPYFPQQQTG